MAVPADDEIEQALTNATFLHQLIGLVDYIGEGKALTQIGNLKLVDGKELVELLGTGDRVDEWIGDQQFKTRSSADLGGLDLVFQVAVAAKLLKRPRKGNKVVPGAKARLARKPSLDLADAAFRALLFHVGPSQHLHRVDQYGFDWFAEELDAQLPDILLHLYLEPSDGVDELSGTAWAVLNAYYDLSDLTGDKADFHRRLVARDLRCIFHQLAELGVVRVVDEEVTEGSHGRQQVSGGRVKLDVLGWSLVHPLAAEVGDAPVIGAFRLVEATELLRAAADLPESEARGEIELWLREGGEVASEQLAEAMIAAPAVERSLAYHGIRRSGAGLVYAFDERPELADVATVFAVDQDLVPVSEVERGEDPEGWVALLATVVEFWGPELAATAWASQTAGPDGVQRMLDRAWRISGEDTETVLGAVASFHLDKAVARRRARPFSSSARSGSGRANTATWQHGDEEDPCPQHPRSIAKPSASCAECMA